MHDMHRAGRNQVMQCNASEVAVVVMPAAMSFFWLLAAETFTQKERSLLPKAL